ncbi:MAG TPA: hypothetical protein VLL52_17465 [Anaerolineae bacterium]|nr:hypothetical protein [Anaerolineae bacterium]
MRWFKILVGIVCVGVLIWLVRSRDGLDKLRMEEIGQFLPTGGDRNRDGSMYAAKEVGLVIVASSNDVNKVVDWIGDDSGRRLREIDYDNYLGVVFLGGLKPVVHDGVEIQSVAYGEGELVVEVDNLHKRPGGAAALSSPYHVVMVERPVEWVDGQGVELVVWFDGKEVIRERVVIEGYVLVKGRERFQDYWQLGG